MASISAVTVDGLSIPGKPQATEATGLVARAKKGDGSACHALFKAHAGRVHALSLRLAGEAFQAESLTRDIFIAAFANLNGIFDDHAFAAEVSRQASKTLAARYFRRGLSEPGKQHLNPKQHLNLSGKTTLPRTASNR